MSASTFNAAELQELLSAKDVDLENTEQAASAFTDTWAQADSASEVAWWNAWTVMRGAYNAQAASARRYLDLLELTLFSLSDYDATTEYTAVMRALNANWPNTPYAQGSFDDLSARLTVAETLLNFVSPVQPSPIPQPNPSNDSGENPTGFLGYLTGAAWKLGFLKQEPPQGTPGTESGPPLVPVWLKWTALGGLALVALDRAIALKEELP